MVQNEVCAKYKETFVLIMIVCPTPLENFLGMRRCALMLQCRFQSACQKVSVLVLMILLFGKVYVSLKIDFAKFYWSYLNIRAYKKSGRLVDNT